MNTNKIVKIRTEHSSFMKTLFDVLKEVLTEVNITFIENPEKKEENKISSHEENTNEHEENSNNEEECEESEDSEECEDNQKNNKKTEDKLTSDNKENNEVTNEVKKNKGGMKIVAVDDHITLMIYVKLDAENFQEFYVKYKTVSIGLDLREFHKFMKGVDKDCIMAMSIDKDEQQKIEFHLHNQVKGIDKYYRQKLLDIDDNVKRMPKETEFEMTVMIKTAEFKKICTEMSQFSEHIEIICTCKEIIFKCVGDQSELTMKLKNNDNSKNGETRGVTILALKNEKKTPIVQGIYNLKHLVTFGRCIYLCEDMQLYLRNSYPLFIHYTVGCLGKMLVGLAPIDHKMLNQPNNYNEKIYKK